MKQIEEWGTYLLRCLKSIDCARPLIPNIYKLLGNVYGMCGKKRECERTFRECWEFLCSIYGKDAPDSQEAKQQWAEIVAVL